MLQPDDLWLKPAHPNLQESWHRWNIAISVDWIWINWVSVLKSVDGTSQKGKGSHLKGMAVQVGFLRISFPFHSIRRACFNNICKFEYICFNYWLRCVVLIHTLTVMLLANSTNFLCMKMCANKSDIWFLCAGRMDYFSCCDACTINWRLFELLLKWGSVLHNSHGRQLILLKRWENVVLFHLFYFICGLLNVMCRVGLTSPIILNSKKKIVGLFENIFKTDSSIKMMWFLPI